MICSFFQQNMCQFGVSGNNKCSTTPDSSCLLFLRCLRPRASVAHLLLSLLLLHLHLLLFLFLHLTCFLHSSFLLRWSHSCWHCRWSSFSTSETLAHHHYCYFCHRLDNTVTLPSLTVTPLPIPHPPLPRLLRILLPPSMLICSRRWAFDADDQHTVTLLNT